MKEGAKEKSKEAWRAEVKDEARDQGRRRRDRMGQGGTEGPRKKESI